MAQSSLQSEGKQANTGLYKKGRKQGDWKQVLSQPGLVPESEG